MAKGVGRYRLLDARGLGLALDHDEYHGTGEVMASPVEKHIVLLAGLDGHLPSVVEPIA